jgi:hypothetical protein
MFRRTLQSLRLEFPNKRPPRFPFPQLLVAQPVAPLNPAQPENAFVDLADNNENHAIVILSSEYATPQKWANLRKRSQSDPQPLIWVVSPHQIPPADVTPLFNISRYFNELVAARGAGQVSAELGRYLLYGEAVTSTHCQLFEWVNKQCYSEQSM